MGQLFPWLRCHPWGASAHRRPPPLVKNLTPKLYCGFKLYRLLVLPDADEFDVQINLSLTRRQKNSTKELLKCRNPFKLINSHVPFDYLVLNGTQDFYPLTFRAVRFKLSENTYEAVLRNLPSDAFPPDEVKATPHNIVCGGWRKIWPANALLFLEIHKVFLRKSAFLRIQIFSPFALVELCGIALMTLPWAYSHLLNKACNENRKILKLFAGKLAGETTDGVLCPQGYSRNVSATIFCKV